MAPSHGRHLDDLARRGSITLDEYRYVVAQDLLVREDEQLAIEGAGPPCVRTRPWPATTEDLAQAIHDLRERQRTLYAEHRTQAAHMGKG